MGIHVSIRRQGECVLIHDERGAEFAAQAVQRGAERLLRGGAFEVGPEEGEQVFAGERLVVRGEIIHQRAALAADEVNRLAVALNSRRAQKMDR